jgi:hypothetical protein
VLDGASALHVRVSAAGNFVVGGREVEPERFVVEVLSALGLPVGQPVVLAGRGASPPPEAVRAAAAALARQASRPVLTTDHDLHISAEALVARVGFDAGGRPAVSPGTVLLMAPDGRVLAMPGPDLRIAVREARSVEARRRPRRSIQWAAGVEQ